MGVYQLWGAAKGLFDAFQPSSGGRKFAGSFLYQSGTEFGLINADGSSSFFYGTGLQWDAALGKYTAGTITRILHYSGGNYTDQLDGIAISASAVQAGFEASAGLQDLLLAGDDTLDAGNRAGNATINAVLDGGTGDDILKGGKGNDILNGGDGNDQLIGNAGADSLRGGSGSDVFDGGTGTDWANYFYESAVAIDFLSGFFGGAAAGDSFISVERFGGSNTGADSIKGGAGNDFFIGQGGNDILEGRAGNDYLSGGRGRDYLDGGDGDDRLYDIDTGNSVDTLLGGAGKDLIVSGSGNDIIDGGSGEDVIKGGAGDDLIYGGPDPDVIVYGGTRAQNTFRYEFSDFSIFVDGPDGHDHVFSALRLAFDDGTWRYDVPTVTWIKESNITGQQWIDTLA